MCSLGQYARMRHNKAMHLMGLRFRFFHDHSRWSARQLISDFAMALMNLEECLGEPKPLSYWLNRLGEFPAEGWLLIERGTASFAAKTPCWPIVVNGQQEFSPEEQDQFEDLIDESSFTEFLCDRQLEDIVINLSQQKPNYTDTDLMSAIGYYWENDAFYVVPSA